MDINQHTNKELIKIYEKKAKGKTSILLQEYQFSSVYAHRDLLALSHNGIMVKCAVEEQRKLLHDPNIFRRQIPNYFYSYLGIGNKFR